jgi:hypothetical protein
MSLSMYQAAGPAFVQMLNNLSAILDKAEARGSAFAGNAPAAALLQFSLDRHPFRFQKPSGQLNHIAGVVIAFCSRLA